MEEFLKTAIRHVALAVEAGATIFIVIGALEAMYLVVRRVAVGPGSGVVRKREIWVRFAVWLLLALEFELAADVLETAISPNWNDVGQLAAIAGIRTVLNYFLEKDIDKYGESPPAPARTPAMQLT
jgi:uncharacterized membrane protein